MATSVYLVTGVTRGMGLGYGIVKGLLEQGHFVYAAGRDGAQVQSLLDQLPDRKRTAALSLDLTAPDTIAAALRTIESDHGRLDGLVNNAAAFFDAGNEIATADLDQLTGAFAVNTVGTVRLTQACLPLLQKTGRATIVNITSGAGSFRDPVFGMAAHPQHVPIYAMTKAATNAFTVKLARELDATTVRVNAVCPGWVATYPGTAEMGARPVSEAVPGVLWAADFGKVGGGGGFYRDGEGIEW